jgi:hypothetical protein
MIGNSKIADKSLTDLTELRIRCAEVMGKLTKCDGGDCFRDERGYWICDLLCYSYNEANLPHYKPFPHYDTDRNALQELIQAVPLLKHDRFVSELILMVGYLSITNYSAYLMLTAPPEAVMRAFLATMEEE